MPSRVSASFSANVFAFAFTTILSKCSVVIFVRDSVRASSAFSDSAFFSRSMIACDTPIAASA
ncbi:hypothetical protein [Burkholderia cenocepacia]|uniref:hypothetical protein n=1 Tax=Burkholderia cenocepacia TaxID=95486 RepID=UPI002011F7E3|nr:hypothetical protein [Burkholderia cenocepacia]